jgi:hypothetical protein
MLLDHIWATVVPGQEWMTCVGRLAFPIFAFLAVEGYFHTHSFRGYALRLMLWAVISEVPFDLMYSGEVCFPYHQNVLWTLLLALLGIRMMEAVRADGKSWAYGLTAVAVVVLGWLVGSITMVDYYGAGVLTVFVFYFFRGRKWWCLAGQIVALFWINTVLLKGLFYTVTLFGVEFEFYRQSFALLALIPIWLYRGRQGCHSRAFHWACYAFYPVHMLVLEGIARLM